MTGDTAPCEWWPAPGLPSGSFCLTHGVGFDHSSDGRPIPCPATILILDERGSLTDTCDLPRGHPGPHRSERTACKPKAWLSWEGSYGDGSASP